MIKKLLLALALVVASLPAVASDCPNLYPNNTPIVVENTVELCNSFFVIIHDQRKRATILTSSVVRANQPRVERVDSFRADVRLPHQYRIEPHHYSRSGYDRGHMVPAGDAATPSEMRETFVMTNMTPQHPGLNREAWRDIEHEIRGMVRRSRSDAIVVTGAVYDATPKTIGSAKVPVPAAYYKVVYLKTGALAFYAENVDNAQVKKVDVKLLARQTGLPLDK